MVSEFTGPPAASLTMPHRRGIERLRWLEGDSEFTRGTIDGPKLRNLDVLEVKEVSVEVTYALIEEIHDFTAMISRLVAEANET